MKRICFLLCILGGFFVTGCMENDLRGVQTLLEVEDCSVPADMEDGDVELDITVTSNKSWTAEIQDRPDWIRSEDLQHVNPTGITEDGTLHLSFARNESYTPRTATIIFHAEGIEDRSITVTQLGKSARIRIVAESGTSVEAEPSSAVRLKVLSNVSWIAEVEGSSTASVTLDKSAGNGDGYIGVTFEPNYEIDQVRTAVITVSSPGVEPQKVELVQQNNTPFIRLYESSSTLDVNPNKESAKISIRTNSKWQAEVVSSTLGSLTLDKVAGEGGWTSIYPSFAANTSDDILSASIRFSLTDYPEVSLTTLLTQKAGKVIEMTFERGSTLWEPALPSTLKTNFSGRYKFVPEDYEVVFHVLQGDAFCLFDATSLCFSNGSLGISWIEFPCLDGMALSSLYIHGTNTAGRQTFYVYDSIDNEGNRGNALGPSARMDHINAAVDEICWGDTTPWTLAPQEGQSVFLYQSKQQNAKIDNITLIFTKI